MRWLKNDSDYLQTIDFVAFDTETTGLWAPANRIVEIGAVKFRLGESGFKQFQSLVNPERSIPLETINVHGITDSMVKDSPTIETVLDDFFDFCGTSSVLIAHNAPFDISFIFYEIERLNREQPNYTVIDTVDISRKYFPGQKSYSLLSLAQSFKIAQNQNHRATEDAILVWKLFTLAAEKFPSFGSSTDFKREFIRYDFNQYQSEQKQLPEEYAEINKAIQSGCRLQIQYVTQGRPPHNRVIRPTNTFWHKSNYYLTAFCEQADAERMFRLDRIKHFKILQ